MMTPGTGASNAGVIEVAFPSKIVMSPGGWGACSATINGGMWTGQANVNISTSSTVSATVDFVWNNTPGNMLIANDNYFINYHCGTATIQQGSIPITKFIGLTYVLNGVAITPSSAFGSGDGVT